MRLPWLLGAGAALAVALSAGLGVWGSRTRGTASPDGLAPPGGAGPIAPGPAAAAPPEGGVAPALPASLRGTRPDGALVTDASGAFAPTRDALDLFDYYLSAVGEEPLARIVARIEAAIRARLDPPDAALALLDRYLAYREAVRRLVESEGLDALPLDRRLQRLRELRREIFGAELAASLFEAEEQRAREVLAWRRVALDPALDPGERARRLADLERAWPESERARRARVTVAQRVIARDAALRAEGAGEGEIHAARVRELGPQAADRLAALDRERAEWEARVAHYRDERARLEARGFRDPAEGRAALEALRASLFQGPELTRIRALDQLASAAGR